MLIKASDINSVAKGRGVNDIACSQSSGVNIKTIPAKIGINKLGQIKYAKSINTKQWMLSIIGQIAWLYFKAVLVGNKANK